MWSGGLHFLTLRLTVSSLLSPPLVSPSLHLWSGALWGASAGAVAGFVLLFYIHCNIWPCSAQIVFFFPLNYDISYLSLKLQRTPTGSPRKTCSPSKQPQQRCKRKFLTLLAWRDLIRLFLNFSGFKEISVTCKVFLPNLVYWMFLSIYSWFVIVDCYITVIMYF